MWCEFIKSQLMKPLSAGIALLASFAVAQLAGCIGEDCHRIGTCGPYIPPPGICLDYDAPVEQQEFPCPDAGDESRVSFDGDAGADGTRATTNQEAGKDGGAEGNDPDAAGNAGPQDASAGDAVADVAPEAAPANCLPRDGGCVEGIFVAPRGSDAGNGSKAQPFGNLTVALRAAQGSGKPVYACDDGTGFSEQLTVDSSLDGVVAYGGFDCGTWAAGSSRTVVRSGDTTALRITGLKLGAVFERFEFRSADATASGSSSIAVMVDSSKQVVLRNVKITAGKGADGKAGVDGAKGQDGQPAEAQQQGANATCLASARLGGAWGAASACGSRGGPGGDGKQGMNGTGGVQGAPSGTANGGSAGGGNGSPGAVGGSGTVGSAAPNGGTFSPSGYAPAGPGGDGLGDGEPGQGGGGGGASDASFGNCWGASGGAGGMGGCGGKLGTGGTSGGASVALLTWESEVTLDSCIFFSSNGGNGGKGGNGGLGGKGQAGAIGGLGYSEDAGVTIGPGGKGGKGGDGGFGAPGAGGNGGPSHVIVTKGSAPLQLGSTTLTHGASGQKGTGGTAGETKAPNGSDGNAVDILTVQ